MKGSEFLLKISSANMKKIANGVKIHFIQFTLVLVIWKNLLIRVFRYLQQISVKSQL